MDYKSQSVWGPTDAATWTGTKVTQEFWRMNLRAGQENGCIERTPPNQQQAPPAGRADMDERTTLDIEGNCFFDPIKFF